LESSSAGKKKRLSPSSLSQIQILSVLSNNGTPAAIAEPKRLQISEIAELSGLRDEKETQRYLFILEGQKLVTPFPDGDFTSKVWQITNQGVQTLKHISTTAGN
jgi:hypothetical protein